MPSNSPVVNTQFFHSCGLTMQYATWGTGSNVLLAFHGFSRSHRDYVSFTKNIQDDFTIYAFDLFFHEGADIGNRKPDKEPLLPKELKTFFEEFLKSIQAEKVWLMGYSLGGRIALMLVELMPQKIGGLYLFAPDGLIVNKWYALLSFSAPGRSLFRFFIKQNVYFLNMLDFVVKIGLVSEKRKKFALANIKTPELQWMVYNVWTFLRKAEPNLKELAGALSANGISVDLFMGKYDQVIPIKNAKRLKKFYPEMKIHILESGHVMLTTQVAKVIEENGWYDMPD